MSSSKYPRYESYKDSGVEWLGEVPASWDVKRLKTIAALVTSKAVSADYPVALENIEGWTGRFLPTDTEFQAEGTAFRKGDVLFGKLRPYLAKVWLADRSGEAVGDIFTLRPEKETYGQYLRNVLVTPEIIKMLDGSTFGSKMPRVSWDFMSTLRLPVPPVGEQESIAAFLDRETAKIDNLIAKQERLIELLTEKRQAAITQAVTKGLDPSVPMKDSDVEWLGKVPAHWGELRLKNLASCNDEVLPESTPDDYEIQYVEVSDVDELTGISGSTTVKFSEAASRARRRVRHGDVIISTVRTYLRSIASVKSPDANLIVSTGFAVIRPVKIDPSFARYALVSEAFIGEVIARSTGVSYPAINASELMRICIPVPKIEEQLAIAKFLDRETAKIDALIEKSKRAIELQKEHRASLISAAVTGNIDVRGLV